MKKRILFILQLPPPVHGTSVMNQSVVENARILNEYQCSILPLQFARSISDIGKFSIGKIWLMVAFCFKLPFRLLRERPSVVYYSFAPVGSAFYRDALFSLIINLFGRKIIFHLHGKGIREAADSSFIKRILYKLVFRNNAVIVLSDLLKDDIASVYKGKPFVLANGIKPFNISPCNALEPEPVFIYLSNLVKSKGIEIFLQSLRVLHEKNIPFKAFVVGASADLTIESVKEYVRTNELEHKVQVLGPLFGEEKQRILAQANVFVFPTYYPNEAFPLTILEAMQTGIAIIASDNGAIKEIITDGVNGFVVPKRDVLATAAKMEILATNATLRSQMGKQSKEKFEQCYTIERFGEDIFGIFQQVTS